jgi:outer membrane protein TolC
VVRLVSRAENAASSGHAAFRIFAGIQIVYGLILSSTSTSLRERDEMKISSRGPRAGKWILAAVILSTSLLPAPLLAEPIPLKRVVELALAHATGAAIAAADEQHAIASYDELHTSYIPQLTAGAGLGPPAYGFPLSLEGQPPSLFNINMQSALINFSLRDFLKAAKIESAAAALKTKDQRSQIIQDAVLSYAELAKWDQRLSHLQQTAIDADKIQTAVTERTKEGIDTELDRDRARLSAARIHLRITEAQGSADVLRDHLSKLTGLPAASIETEPDTLPDFPTLAQDASTPTRAAETNPNVQAARDHARAQYLRAQGEHRAFWPSFDLAGQYALLSSFNNFQDYYIPEKTCPTSIGTFLCPNGGYRQNNASIGVSIRFPFLNLSQRAHARAADADAIKASKQAEAARNQVSEETLRLQRSVAQMQAARDVAQLEYEIAQKTIAAVQTRMDAGTATLHDLDDARSQASERFITLQDVNFELERSQLALLRSTGDLEKWALGTP